MFYYNTMSANPLILCFEPCFDEPCFTFYVLPYHYVLVYSPELSKRMFYPLSPQYQCLLRKLVLPFMFYHSTMFLSIQLVLWSLSYFVDPCFTFYILPYHYVLLYLPELSKPLFYPLSPQYLTVEISLWNPVLPFMFYHRSIQRILLSFALILILLLWNHV